MRTALTLGFKENGTAEIISGPEVDLNEQQRAFNNLTAGKSSKYARVELWESDGGMRRTKSFSDKGTVNFNAAHPVEDQSAKGKKKKKGKSGSDLADLTPTSGGTGGVDFNAAHPVEKQQDKKLSKKLPDLNKAQDQGATGKKSGVNFDSVIPVEDQGKSKKSATKKTAAKKSSPKKSAARSALNKSSSPSAPAPAAEENRTADEGPTL